MYSGKLQDKSDAELFQVDVKGDEEGPLGGVPQMSQLLTMDTCSPKAHTEGKEASQIYASPRISLSSTRRPLSRSHNQILQNPSDS